MNREIKNTIEWGKVQGPMTWHKAKLLEIDGWKLPGVTKLTSMFNYIKGAAKEKSMENKIFWSEASAADPSNAWVIYFDNGYVSYSGKNDSYFVRLVRDIENTK